MDRLRGSDSNDALRLIDEAALGVAWSRLGPEGHPIEGLRPFPAEHFFT